MPPPRTPTETHRQLITQVLSDDAELRDMAREFVKAGFKELLNQLHRGDAQTRAVIARSLAQTVTKAITEVEDVDTNADLRTEMQQMMSELRGELMPDDEELPDAQVLRLVPKA